MENDGFGYDESCHFWFDWWIKSDSTYLCQISDDPAERQEEVLLIEPTLPPTAP